MSDKHRNVNNGNTNKFARKGNQQRNHLTGSRVIIYNNDVEKGLRRLKKLLSADRTFQHMKDHEFHVKPSEKKRIRHKKAISEQSKKTLELEMDGKLNMVGRKMPRDGFIDKRGKMRQPKGFGKKMSRPSPEALQKLAEKFGGSFEYDE